MKSIILASTSPRRSDLLRQVGLPFEVIAPEVDESRFSFDVDPEQTAERLALQKALSVARRISTSGRLVIGADTVVQLDREILGKPRGADDACAMLRRLAGRSHRVLTGFAIAETGINRSTSGHEWTTVYMRNSTDLEISDYVDTGEPLDKAGSYGANALGAAFITRVEGCFYNVIGLPLARLLITLDRFGQKETKFDQGDRSIVR